MSSSANHFKAEELARKHGQSSNLKSNFKYLMSAKTNRTSRNNQKSKQNEIQSVLMKEVHKFATKTLTPKPNLQDCQSLVLPLSSIEPWMQSSSNQVQNQSVQKIKRTDSYNQKSNNHENEESCQALELESKLQIQASQARQALKYESAETACMTQGCFYEKQLQIKIQLLQKERDDIWNRIASTLHENITLKEQVQRLTRQIKTTNTLATQTDSIISLQTDIQTQIDLEEMSQYDQQLLSMQRQVLQGQKIKREVQEAKIFCQTVVGEVQLSNQSDLKSCIAEFITTKMLRITQQSQQQSQLRDQIHNQQIAQLKQQLESYRQKLAKAEQLSKQNCKVRQNIESLYMKQMNEIKGLLGEKERCFEAQIDRLTQEFRNRIQCNEKQNKRYLDYMESASCGWKQKQKLYSALLSQAHKTIKGLMAQMKEFQQLAYTNYSKYLQSQKIHILQLLPKDNDQQ